jgi:hypothetical protein
MAQRLVNAKTPIPGLDKKTSNAVLGGLKLQLKEKAKADKAAQEAAAARARLETESAEGARKQSETEQQFSREKDARDAAVRARLEAEGVAERENIIETARALVDSQSVREADRFRTAQQTALFPETREKIQRQTREGEAPEAVTLDSYISRVQARLADVEQQLDEMPPPPSGAEGPWSDTGNAARLVRRKQQLQNVLSGLEARRAALDTEDTATQTVAVPPAGAQIDTRPQPTLLESARDMAQRALASPQVDEETKALVAQVQDSLPQLEQLITARPQ